MKFLPETARRGNLHGLLRSVSCSQQILMVYL